LTFRITLYFLFGFFEKYNNEEESGDEKNKEKVEKKRKETAIISRKPTFTFTSWDIVFNLTYSFIFTFKITRFFWIHF